MADARERAPGATRRGFLALAGAGLGTAAAAVAATTPARPGAPAVGSGPEGNGAGAQPDPPAGAPVQPGIVTPNPAQSQLLTLAYTITGITGTTTGAAGPTGDASGILGQTLDTVATVVQQLHAGTAPALLGMAPGDLTATVGIGPRIASLVSPTAPGAPAVPGAEALPEFGQESLDPARSGGDLVVQLCASDPLVLPGAQRAVTLALRPYARPRWEQRAFRGPSVALGPGVLAPRNLLGFVDGIVVPRAPRDLAADVWLGGGDDPRLRGATIMVCRRMEVDLDRFGALPTAGQEAVLGRRRDTSAPLSGGTGATDPDLLARSPTGAYLIPADAHLRRANPASTGVPTMLRRSYSFADGTASGLFFVSFQNSLQTFVRTLRRMEAGDALLAYTRTTGSASFLVLPVDEQGRLRGADWFR